MYILSFYQFEGCQCVAFYNCNVSEMNLKQALRQTLLERSIFFLIASKKKRGYLFHILHLHGL